MRLCLLIRATPGVTIVVEDGTLWCGKFDVGSPVSMNGLLALKYILTECRVFQGNFVLIKTF